MARATVTKAEARSAGLKRYFTGLRCAHGHRAERYVSTGTCCVCASAARAMYEKRNAGRARERHRAISREWYRANRERHYVGTRKWALEHPGSVTAITHAHRAARYGAEGRFTCEDITAIFADQDGLCAGCAGDLSSAFDIDHKTPLSRGGSNWPINIQLLCRSCNCSKGSLTMEEWRARKVPAPTSTRKVA